MKKIDRLILAIFSIIILVESIVLCIVIAGWINFNTVSRIISTAITGNASTAVLIVSVVCMLLALKCIFFGSTDKKNTIDGQGVLMQNDNGKLMISKATLVNLVEGVVKDFGSTELAGTKIDLDNENHVIVDINIVVGKEVIIKELTVNMQNKIREAIKTTSDLDVKEVNVRIKNIATTDNENK